MKPTCSFAAIALASLLAPVALGQTQTPFPGSAIPQFAQPLPTLSVAGGSIATVFGNAPLTIRMCEFDAKVLPPGTFAPGAQPQTRVWGYIEGSACPTMSRDTYTGPVIVNVRGTPTPITYVNELGSTATTGVLAYKNSVDQTLHWADPFHQMCEASDEPPEPGSICAQNYSGPIPAVAHLHGGEVPPELDGGPDSWFTSDGLIQGHAYYSFAGAAGNEAIYRYPNLQEAAPIWFHDHTLGATRLNVYAGLAGAYLIVDPNLQLPANLPGPAEIVPLVIQDRTFVDAATIRQTDPTWNWGTGTTFTSCLIAVDEDDDGARPDEAVDEILGADAVGAEPADRHARTVERQRRNHGVDTRSVLEARVHHRARFVDAPSDHADDPFDDPQQVRVVLEDDVGFLEAAVALDVDLVVAVHQDVRDLRIGEQRLEWTQAEDLVEHVDNQRVALEEAQRSRLALAIQEIADQAADLRFSVFPLHAGQALEVETPEQLFVNPSLQGLVQRVPDVGRLPGRVPDVGRLPGRVLEIRRRNVEGE